jgi:hypothetical protein
MRKIMLLGFSTVGIVFGAFGVDARSSDEEDAPQSTAQSGHDAPLHRLHHGATAKAGQKPPVDAPNPAIVPQQENTFGGGY